MKDLMKTPFPLAGKSCFHWLEYLKKFSRKWFQRVGIMLFFKNWPTFNFKNALHWLKKALKQCKTFVINQTPFPLAKIKDSLRNTISVDENTASI